MNRHKLHGPCRSPSVCRIPSGSPVGQPSQSTSRLGYPTLNRSHLGYRMCSRSSFSYLSPSRSPVGCHNRSRSPVGGHNRSRSHNGGHNHSRSPVGGHNRSRSPVGGHNCSRSPIGGHNHSRSPVGGPNHSRSHNGGHNRSRSPVGGHNHNRSPVGGHNRSRSPVGGPNHSRSHNGGHNRSRSPVDGHNHNRSPVGSHSRSRSPIGYPGHRRGFHNSHRSNHLPDNTSRHHSSHGSTHSGYTTNHSMPLRNKPSVSFALKTWFCIDFQGQQRIPNYLFPQNSSSRPQGNYQQNKRPQNSNNQHHMWQNTRAATMYNDLAQEQRQQQQHQQWQKHQQRQRQQQHQHQQQWQQQQRWQQQQQQCGMRESREDMDLTHITMTQLPFLQKLTAPRKIKILPHDTQWTSYTFDVEETLVKYFRVNCTTSPYQVVVRFCKFVEGVEQKDNFSRNLQMKVNGSSCPIPGQNVVPKLPATPIEITSKCDFQRNRNTIEVKTSDDVIVMFVDVVKRLTKEKVAEKVLKENPLDPAATVAKIKEKLEEDTANEADITLTSLQFSLVCPVSKIRMKLPCRASTCQHLQCFDAAFYLKMNENKSTWRCPICSRVIQYKNLQIDMHFKNILEQNISTNKILLQIDGSFLPFQPEHMNHSILTLDETLDHSPAREEDPNNSTSSVEHSPAVVMEPVSAAGNITIDLLTDDDDDDDSVKEFLSEQELLWIANEHMPEVVTLSDDEASDRPPHSASLQDSDQEVSSDQEVTTTTTSRQKESQPLPTSPTTTNSHSDVNGDNFKPLCTADVYML